MLARSRSLRTSLRLSRLDNKPISACHASASIVGCVRNLSYGAESSVYLTRDIPPLRRPQFKPCSLKQCTATTPITLHSPLYTLNFAQRLRTGKRHRRRGRGRKARLKTERRAAVHRSLISSPSRPLVLRRRLTCVKQAFAPAAPFALRAQATRRLRRGCIPRSGARQSRQQGIFRLFSKASSLPLNRRYPIICVMTNESQI